MVLLKMCLWLYDLLVLLFPSTDNKLVIIRIWRLNWNQLSISLRVRNRDEVIKANRTLVADFGHLMTNSRFPNLISKPRFLSHPFSIVVLGWNVGSQIKVTYMKVQTSWFVESSIYNVSSCWHKHILWPWDPVCV